MSIVEKLLLKVQKNKSLKIVGQNKIKLDIASGSLTDYKKNIEEIFFIISTKSMHIPLSMQMCRSMKCFYENKYAEHKHREHP